MAQFDVHANPGPEFRREFPFPLDVQHDLFNDLDTRVVVPLRRADLLPVIKRLNPTFKINGRDLVMMPIQIATLPKSLLGPAVSSLAAERYAVIGALDFMLTGV